jgi:hypothetical protein
MGAVTTGSTHRSITTSRAQISLSTESSFSVSNRRLPTSSRTKQPKLLIGRLQKRSSWQPTFVHLDRGSRTIPVVIAKMQVNNSVGAEGHNKNRFSVMAGPPIGLR